MPVAPLLLNKHQAKAVYSAMCELNNVAGTVSATFRDSDLLVKEQYSGHVTIYHGPVVREVYLNQAAFALAYRVE